MRSLGSSPSQPTFVLNAVWTSWTLLNTLWGRVSKFEQN